MHQLTGDFYTVGEILGHTLKGIGMSLGISTNLESVTAQYVDVQLERKKLSLKPTTKPYTHKKTLPKKEQSKSARRKNLKRKAAKWSYNGNIFL